LAAPLQAAAPSWLAPVSYTETAVELPAIAANPSGDSAVVWLEGAGHQSVRAIFRPAGGPVIGPETIGDSDQNPRTRPSMPVVAVDSRGNAVALWRRIEDGLHSRIQESFRPAGGDWGPVQQLTAADESAAYPRLAVDASGVFVATWENGLASSVVDVARAPAGGQFGPAQTVSGPDALESNLAVNANGDAAVTWVAAPPHLPPISFVQAVTAPAGGSFGPPQSLSPNSDNAEGPAPAVAPDGRATVVWTQPRA
jgi:hypothetical protein